METSLASATVAQMKSIVVLSQDVKLALTTEPVAPAEKDVDIKKALNLTLFMEYKRIYQG